MIISSLWSSRFTAPAAHTSGWSRSRTTLRLNYATDDRNRDWVACIPRDFGEMSDPQSCLPSKKLDSSPLRTPHVSRTVAFHEIKVFFFVLLEYLQEDDTFDKVEIALRDVIVPKPSVFM